MKPYPAVSVGAGDLSPGPVLAQQALLPTESFLQPFPVCYDTDPLTRNGQLFCDLSLTLGLLSVFWSLG